MVECGGRRHSAHNRRQRGEVATTRLLNFAPAYRLKRPLPEKRDPLDRVGYARCHAPLLTDDLVVQDTMAKASTKVHQLGDQERPEPRPYRVSARCWKDHLRSRRETQKIDDFALVNPVTPADRSGLPSPGPIAPGPTPSADPGGFEGLPMRKQADLPVGTVMRRLNRARAALAGLLHEHRSALLSERPVEVNLRRVK